MTIRVHVACDDTAYRAAIADYLATEREIEVVGVSDEGQVGAAAVRLLAPDVIVLRAAATADAAQHVRAFRTAAPGRALIAFCAAAAEAERCRQAGADRVVLEAEPARELRAAVKAAFRRVHSAPLREAVLHS